MTGQSAADDSLRRTALVTGASSGIGRAIALRLAARGLRVFGTSRRTEAASGERAFEILPLDVQSDDSVKSCIDRVLVSAGRLDVVVNNAGYALFGGAEETSVEEAEAQFETNFFGVVRVVNAILPTMRKRGEGTIINMGSLAGLTAIPFMPFYSASKFALEGYSEALWHELTPLGIRVALIEPTFVRTALIDGSVVAKQKIGSYDGARERAAAASRRFASNGIAAEEVAAQVAQIVDNPSTRLRYRVGSDARWLPRLKAIAPWRLFAAGVQRRFLRDARA